MLIIAYKGEANKNTDSNNSRNNKPYHQRNNKQGQSYMWRVKIYKKKLLGNRTTLVSTKVFTNKVEAMTYQNNNTGDGYVATIEKWDPTKNR